MSKLEWALWNARRGFRVFPCVPNGKEPAITSFSLMATKDENQIRHWWAQNPDYNIGVQPLDGSACDIIADIDTKKGEVALHNFYEVGGHFNTFTVRTPSGGWHAYFTGTACSLAPLAFGVDIRSYHGFVLGAGSCIDGVAYEIVSDLECAPVPQSIAARLRPPLQKVRVDDRPELRDSPAGIMLATAYLQHDAPFAIEGMGGNSTTYSVAARVINDFCLTDETAFELLDRHYNATKCVPAWDRNDLWALVEHAESYAKKAAGNALPSVLMGTVATIPSPEQVHAEQRSRLTFGNTVPRGQMQPRPWVIPGLLMRRAVTAMLATGGAGKSALGLTIAAHLSLGRRFGDYQPVCPSKVIVFNAEDDIEEQSKRFEALCASYGFDVDQTKKNIMFIDAKDWPMKVAAKTRDGVAYNTNDINCLDAFCAAPEVSTLIVDPLVEIHDCDENDNVQMKSVMGIFRDLAIRADVSVLIMHHTGKGAAERPGDADVARGASSVVNSSRLAFTLVPPTREDAQEYGIRDTERFGYVRLDSAKANLVARTGQITWFKWDSIKLWTGDIVGVIKPYNMHSRENAVRVDIAERLGRYMLEHKQATLSPSQAMTILRADALYSRMQDHDIRRAVETSLAAGVSTAYGTVTHIRRKREGTSDELIIALS